MALLVYSNYVHKDFHKVDETTACLILEYTFVNLIRINGKHYQSYMSPPLSASEVVTIQKQVEKKDYNYRCKEPPINSYCNAQVCKTRKFGIGGRGSSLEFSSLSKLETDPPVWLLNVGETRIELQTDELQIQTKFQKKCMNALNIMPPLVKQSVWQEIVERLMGLWPVNLKLSSRSFVQTVPRLNLEMNYYYVNPGRKMVLLGLD